MQIDFNKVLKVYNGKSGCMCGCNGKWSTSALNRDLATQDCGYAYDDDQVSDRRVKLLISKVANSPDAQVDTVYGGVKCIYIDNGSRTTAVYVLD